MSQPTTRSAAIGEFVTTNSSRATPTNRKLSFMDLPFELRERIMIDTHEMTLAELPASLPLVTNRCKPLGMSPDAIALRRQRPATITVLRNNPPAKGFTSSELESHLRLNPGQWGPIFQVRYANKQLREEANRIHFREILVRATTNLSGKQTYRDDVLMSRLSKQVLQDHTKSVVLQIFYNQPSFSIRNLVDALSKMKSLKHLCLVLCGDLGRTGRTGDDILLFFSLDIETLSIHWTWPVPLSREQIAEIDPYRTSYLEWFDLTNTLHCIDRVKANRVLWLENVYQPSSWFKDPEKKEKIMPGKVASYEKKDKVDQFTFALPDDRKTTLCPAWNFDPKNPRNHKDQWPSAEAMKAAEPMKAAERAKHEARIAEETAIYEALSATEVDYPWCSITSIQW